MVWRKHRAWRIGRLAMKRLWYWALSPDCVWTEERSSAECRAAGIETGRNFVAVVNETRGHGIGPSYFDLIVRYPFDAKYLQPMRPR